jgi:hypothetical protein
MVGGVRKELPGHVARGDMFFNLFMYSIFLFI